MIGKDDKSQKGVMKYLHNTPLYKLKNLPANFANVFVKLEKYNPGGSIKARIADAMIAEAENQGRLKPFSSQVIVEASGGNTALGLCMCALHRGYQVVLVIPDNYNQARIEQLPLYGAEVYLSDHTTGNDSHFVKVRELCENNKSFFYINQLNNLANPTVHYQRTGKEIVDKLCDINYFITGIGSGGTITGVGKRIKETFSRAKVIGVQPFGCEALQGRAIPHKIQGLSVGLIPQVLDVSIIDDMYSITYEATMQCALDLVETEGLFLGVSSNANIASAIKLASKVGKGKNIVTIAPDSGEFYLNQYIDFKKSLSNTSNN